MTIKNKLLILFTTIFIGCSEQIQMTETEQYLAEKYNSELFSLDFMSENTITTDGETKDRQYIYAVLTNTDDIEKVMNNEDYLKERAGKISSFIQDSLDFGEMSFTPKEIQIEFLQMTGGSFFRHEKKKGIKYKLD
jgi:hypothetical protein